MTRLLVVLQLFASLLRGVLLSGWATARLILHPARRARPCLAPLDTGDLGPGAMSVLAALITLTPGTTALEIDPQRRQILLHLLDGEHADQTLQGIRRDLLTPLHRWLGTPP
jgi:multisubunit Na+/H+ antiporter MnhE subunit